MSNHDPVLVTAATGRQGGATARALLAEGKTSVRVMVRDPDAPNAKALAAAGAEVVVGDLDDPASLRAACAGARAVFSMQSPIVTATGIDFSKERAQGKNLVEAALAAGVGTIVHTATSGVGDHRNVEGWAEGRWKSHEDYWENKLATCELVRSAGFARWTILLPATFMDHPMLDPAGFVDGRRMITVIKTDRPSASSPRKTSARWPRRRSTTRPRSTASRCSSPATCSRSRRSLRSSRASTARSTSCSRARSRRPSRPACTPAWRTACRT